MNIAVPGTWYFTVHSSPVPGNQVPVVGFGAAYLLTGTGSTWYLFPDPWYQVPSTKT